MFVTEVPILDPLCCVQIVTVAVVLLQYNHMF